MKTICVLHSGGLDSTAVLLWYQKKRYQTRSLYIDYGQTTAPTEWKTVKQIHRLLKLPDPIKIMGALEIPNLVHRLLQHGVYKRKKEDFVDHFQAEYFPNRNIYLLTLASMYCYSIRYNDIALGIIDGGDYGYPDTSNVFLKQVDKLFKHTLNMRVHAPFITWNKNQIVQFLNSNGFPPEATYSCNIHSKLACGSCAACTERTIALKSITWP